KEHEVIIQTGDHDMLQLVEKNITIAIMKKGVGNFERYDAMNFKEKFGLTPRQVIEYKALVGDSADNYPGIKGIGDKTDKKLLSTYDTMEEIIANQHLLSKGIQKKIMDEKDDF